MRDSSPTRCYKCGQTVKIYRVELIDGEFKACHSTKCPDSPIEIKGKLTIDNATKQEHEPAHLDLYLDGMDVDSVRPKLMGLMWKNVFIRLGESDA